MRSLLAVDRMRSLDSPVLKPDLIRFSSARLIGTLPAHVASAEGAVHVPLWSNTTDAQEETTPPDVLPASIAADAAACDRSRRQLDAARDRLHAIETEIAAAEARLAESQALLETLQHQASMACTQVEDARQQAAEIRAQAQHEGYQAGLERAEREMADQIAAIAAVAEGAVRARAELLRRSEPEIIDLVCEIARKVISERLAIDKEAVAEVARRALEAAGQADAYYLHLHPDDAATVEQHLQRDTLGIPLQVVPDDRLNVGDCLVRTPHGCVDASIETQLQVLQEQMGAA